MKNYRAVIFDLDGTLANTLEDIADSMNRVLAAHGFPIHPYDAYRFYVGNGLKKLVIRSLPEKYRTDDGMINHCFDRMVEDYGLHYIVKTQLYEGVPELLDALSSQDIRLAVLSNKADSLTQKICRVLLKKWNFDMVMGANERFPRKPDPASALYIANGMGVMPVNVCYLGDTDVDMKTAIDSGFYPVGAGWGFRSKEELVASGARQVISHPLELLEFF